MSRRDDGGEERKVNKRDTEVTCGVEAGACLVFVFFLGSSPAAYLRPPPERVGSASG